MSALVTPTIDAFVPDPQHDYRSSGGYGFVLNSPGGGAQVRNTNFTALRRPYFDRQGFPSVTLNLGRWTTEKGERVPLKEHRRISDLLRNNRFGAFDSPVFNATTLRKEEWIELDKTVLRAARYRLRAWADLSAANSFGGFNAMGKTVLEHETMADPGEAIVDMDALTEGRTDAPLFQLQGLPLPITHSDFWFSARYLDISRNSGTPVDTSMGEAAGRRVAEAIEKQTIGNNSGIVYGGNSTYVGRLWTHQPGLRLHQLPGSADLHQPRYAERHQRRQHHRQRTGHAGQTRRRQVLRSLHALYEQ
jgi:hypothetical protein